MRLVINCPNCGYENYRGNYAAFKCICGFEIGNTSVLALAYCYECGRDVLETPFADCEQPEAHFEEGTHPAT